MSEYRWDEIKKIAEKIQRSTAKLETSKLVLFGAGRNGSCAYQEIKKHYPVFAFCDNNEKAWGVLMKVYLYYHQNN